MKNKIIYITAISLLFMLFSFQLVPSSYADEVFTVSGQITHLDLSAKILSIEYTDENNLAQEISLVYSGALEVFEAANIESLSVGDKVSADYFYNEQSEPEAVSIYKF